MPTGNGLVDGRIVYFVVDKFVAQDIARQRVGTGGNAVKEGDIVPAMVVKVWDAATGYVNLKLMLDGPDTYWATSVNHSDENLPRTWHWMFEGQATRYEPKAPTA